MSVPKVLEKYSNSHDISGQSNLIIDFQVVSELLQTAWHLKMFFVYEGIK